MNRFYREFIINTNAANLISLASRRKSGAQYQLYSHEINKLLGFYNSFYERSEKELSKMTYYEKKEFKKEIGDRITKIRNCYDQGIDKNKWDYSMLKISNGFSHVKRIGFNKGNHVTTELEILEDVLNLITKEIN